MTLRDAHPLERRVGIDYYVTDPDGVGGQLKECPEDFRVREVEAVDTEPLDADPERFPNLVVRATLRGWDTNDFARALSDRLGISRERVAWAGTKDKRAVTTQLLSVDRIDPDDLPSLEDADLEPIGRFGRRLRFGDLAGNAFEITVRDPDRPANATPITEALAEFGAGEPAVPNWFGQQRFGSRRPITHRVGRRIVDGDWEGAVMAYLGNPSEREPAATQEARAAVEDTRDWQTALDRFPGYLTNERAMLHRLVERDGDEPADFRAALEALPDNLRRLFVHALQSYAFNRIVSERLAQDRRLGRAQAGDVVCFAKTVGDLTVPDPHRTQRVEADQVETVNRHVDRGRAFVTAPLVGTETVLADGSPGAIERDVLDDLGLAPEAFDLPDPYRSSGTRRAVVVRTDLTVERDPLRFAFTLPRGAYATVVLREYLKADPEALE